MYAMRSFRSRKGRPRAASGGPAGTAPDGAVQRVVHRQPAGLGPPPNLNRPWVKFRGGGRIPARTGRVPSPFSPGSRS